MNKGTLTKLDAKAFKEIPTEGIKLWFWTDSDTKSAIPGVHLVSRLPENIPKFATHIWGWGTNKYVRVRVDRSIPEGFVATEFTDVDSVDANCAFQLYSTLSLGWGVQNLAKDAQVLVVRRLEDPSTAIEFVKLNIV